MEYGAHNRLPLDPALLDLTAHELTFTPDLAAQFPHLASLILPAETNPNYANPSLLPYQQAATVAAAPSSSPSPFISSSPQLLQHAQPQLLPVGGLMHQNPSYPRYFPATAVNQENQAMAGGSGHGLPSVVLGSVTASGGTEFHGKPVEGMIFVCNKKTKDECKRLQLFGLPGGHRSMVSRVMPGCKLFLFNYDSKNLTGVFEATCQGAMNITPMAFITSGSFPAQVKIKRVMKVPSIPMEKVRGEIPEIFFSEKKFKYELNNGQVEKLVAMFVAAKEAPSKWAG